MQARAMKNAAAAALGDRAWQRSLGASGLLHGAVIAALLLTWHIEPKPLPQLHPIPVTLIHTDETALERAAQPAEAVPEPPTPQHDVTAPPPVVAATEAPPPPIPSAKPL